MVTTIPVAIIGLIAGFLAYHNDYDDGIFGRSSFFVMVLMAVIICLGDILGHYTYSMPLEFSVLLWAIAVFMVRHVWRFIQYRRKGKYAWEDGKQSSSH